MVDGIAIRWVGGSIEYVVVPWTHSMPGAIINMFVVCSPARKVNVRHCFHKHGALFCVFTPQDRFSTKALDRTELSLETSSVINVICRDNSLIKHARMT